MKTKNHNILTGNQAVARIAYKTNEVCPIYPITPASEMSELVEQWSSEKQKNIFGSVPKTVEMQSEAGVAGTIHGALQTGSLATTFTASQGLLLMMPNMYKIAGELTPNVIHVATRSIATHALSIFGDHSDIMGARSTGYAMLGAASVQEAQDFALISQAATLQSRIPFIHFFDGFRTSHQTSKIELLPDHVIKNMINEHDIKAHRERALNPNNPVVRGTTQGPDTFFQSRESVNPFYLACPDIVQDQMDRFAKLTKRHYQLFDYIGDPKAEHIIISMASSTETIEETIQYLNLNGNKLGLIKVRLFRPFSTNHLLKALPKTVKSIAVLDKTKEPGSNGEPLYLDILKSVSEAFQSNLIKTFPKIVGGRYGLSSKEFTPNMVHAIIKNLKLEHPKNNFTVGIRDDITKLSLDITDTIIVNKTLHEAIFYNEKSNKKSNSFMATLETIGESKSTYIQGFTQCGYKKSNAYDREDLRISKFPIKAPYLIEQADFIGIHNASIFQHENILSNLKPEGTLLVNSVLIPEDFWLSLSLNTRREIILKNITLLITNTDELDASGILDNIKTKGLHACFMYLNKEHTNCNFKHQLSRVINKVETRLDDQLNENLLTKNKVKIKTTFLDKLLQNKGNDIAVSEFPVDGTYPSNTSELNTIHMSEYIPEWEPDLCTQCGACSMACPQAALRIKSYTNEHLQHISKGFKSANSLETDWDLDLLNYTIQINPDQCNGCHNCIDACAVKALKSVNRETVIETERANWKHFETIPEFDRSKLDVSKISQQQLQEPLFKYATGVTGCGEAPYLKLLSQLFGGRLLVANATGASSIFGGALPTTPWAKNKEGKGPAWSNSLFEDNAEFGLGYRLALDQQEAQAKRLLKKLITKLPFNDIHDILEASQKNESEIQKQQVRVDALKTTLKEMSSPDAKLLLDLCDSLVKKSVWIVGGDGWAYDIGYGGIDHVLASGENVNILVLDNEVYDNTGGQASKATPLGAQAKFAFGGKTKQKKDLGQMAMTYDNVYVASVAIGADQEQTLNAFNEAESFDGPSIIIAYCHSESHGIDMKHPSQYHKAAVNSGQWLLYRNNPRREERKLNTLQLDSGVPNISVQEYLKLEGRFLKLFETNKDEFNSLMRQAQKQVVKRFNAYLAKASSGPVNRTKLLQNNKIKQQLVVRR